MTTEIKAIIKSTAPVLKEHGEAITTAMYKNLFSKHPEAQELFKDSEPDQYKKLAAAVYAYADNIDNLDALSKGIATIVAAHVKTHVQPMHYPWVAEALLAAIREVLGDAATEEVINAWTEAFMFLAGVLMAKEQEAYAQA